MKMPYRAAMTAFLLSLALTLLTLVDFRRGFLFASYVSRSLFHVFSPWHVPMLVAGIAGMFASYRGMARHDARTSGASRYVKPLTFAILALLIVDLFTYRGVPAARSIAAGRVNVDWLKAFGVTAWWKPFAQATSYLLNVWHATMIGILISGLALTMLPVYVKPYLVRRGFAGSLFGALFALPQPFCSCCSSVMAPSLTRRGASTSFLLSFVVGAPMLNVTTIVLSLALLPPAFATLRIVAGIVVTVLVTYGVARLADRWERPVEPQPKSTQTSGWVRRLGSFYLRLFDLDAIVGEGSVDTPSRLIATWLYASGRIALVLVPTLWVWSVIASALFLALPSVFGNNMASVVLAALAGTFLMISTWSEIPMALQLIDAGFKAPAAALLVVLPAVSLPCMMVLGGSLQRFRMVALLSGAVMFVGIVAGALFL